MAEPVGNLRCTFGCWAIGGLAGVLAAIMLRLLGDLSWTGAIFCGVLLAVLVGFFLSMVLCRPLPTLEEANSRHAGSSGSAPTSTGASSAAAAGVAAGAVGAAAYAGGASEGADAENRAAQEAHAAQEAQSAADAQAAEAARTAEADAARVAAGAKAAADAQAEADASAAADAQAAADARAAEEARAAADARAADERAAQARADAERAEAANAAEIKASTPLAGEAELAERKGEWTYDGNADGTGGSDTGAAATTAVASGSGDVDYDGDGVVEGANEGTRPAGLDGPRGGTADDLKRIKGVGPKMEKLCNSLGFYHFDQIAAWSSDEVAWVDANLEGFKGRVTRDTWVAQAHLLATGGETEFSKKVDDGDVY